MQQLNQQLLLIIMRCILHSVLLASFILYSLTLPEKLAAIHTESHLSRRLDVQVVSAQLETPAQQPKAIDKPKTDLKFKYFIFEEKCYEIFFADKNFFNFPCLKLTLSKFIGYGLVYGSLIVKAPQILKILMNCSVLGISFSSIVIEALMYSLMMGYNIHKGYPFSIYGENVFLGASNVFIIICFFLFCKQKKYATYIKGTLILLAIAVPLIFQMTPPFIIENSLWLGMIAFILSRYQQIRQNIKNKSTGNLSFLTTFLNFGGNIARSFTILTETSGDFLFLLSNVLPIFINGFILLQFGLYWNNKMSYEAVVEVGGVKKELGEKSSQTLNDWHP